MVWHLGFVRQEQLTAKLMMEVAAGLMMEVAELKSREEFVSVEGLIVVALE